MVLPHEHEHIVLPSPEPMGGPGATGATGATGARRVTARPNRNRPTLSLDPTAPSTPEAIQAVKDHNARQRQRQAWGGHDGLCLVTYVEAHTLRYGKAGEPDKLTEVPPTEAETPDNCWCTCARCFDRASARCVCRHCPCFRPVPLLVSSSGLPHRPSYGFQ